MATTSSEPNDRSPVSESETGRLAYYPPSVTIYGDVSSVTELNYTRNRTDRGPSKTKT